MKLNIVSFNSQSPKSKKWLNLPQSPLLGGDFNTVLEHNIDKVEGILKYSPDAVYLREQLIVFKDLKDIWRVPV